MTTATSVPALTTPAICRATEATTSGSTPSPPPPAKASPLSLSKTRRQPASGACGQVTKVPSNDGWTGSLLNRSMVPPFPKRRLALTRLEPSECADRGAGFSQDVRHRLLTVNHAGLLEQDVVLEVGVHPAFDDLGNRLIGLALVPSRGFGDVSLVFHGLGRHLVAGEELRAHGRDLHSDTLGSLFVAVVGHEHAHLRRQVGGTSVQVSGGGCLQHRHAAEFDLLADDSGHLRHGVLDALAGVETDRQQGLAVTDLTVERRLREGPGQRLEILALGDEVGLAQQLDHGVVHCRDDSVGRGALSATLRSLGGTGDAQRLDRLIEISAALLESLLALHHSRGGHLAKSLHIRGADRCHVLPSSSCDV